MNSKILFVICILVVLATVSVVYAFSTRITYPDSDPAPRDVLPTTPPPSPSPSPTASPTPTEITGTQTISFLEATPSYAGNPLTVIVTLTPAYATNVTLYINGNPYGSPITSTAEGVATFAIPGAAIGAGHYIFTSKADSVTVP